MARRNFFPSFFILIFLSVSLFVLDKTGILSGPVELIGKVMSPLQRLTIGSSSDSEVATENKNLVLKLAEMQKLAAENSALRDQFETSYPKSQNLLPANVVSAPSFVPGLSTPEYLIIDKGSKDSVRVGSVVVIKDNIVGKVTEVSNNLSKLMLVSNPSTSLSGKTVSLKGVASASALGVLRGLGGESLVLDNVVLSDDLAVGDYVVTKGDLTIDNSGYPPSLTVGKITSVEKKSSDLFQRAKVKSLVDFSRLSTIFVVLKNN